MELQKIVKQLECRVFIIDIPLRHLHCCVHHKYSGLLAHYSKANKLLKKIFASKVIEHRKLLGISHNKIKKAKYYQDILCDAVHFHSEYYAKIATALISIVDAGIRPQT